MENVVLEEVVIEGENETSDDEEFVAIEKVELEMSTSLAKNKVNVC
ncbi:hypothetical protein [Streptomyces sp. NRRL F-5126]|nr:hypothetical protein [Streptomyces sp. NRRL F-5126]